MSVLIKGKSPASLVLSWVVKYKIKESLTIRKSLCPFFPYTVFVPVLLDLRRDDIQSSVRYLWREFAQYKSSESRTVQVQSESQSLWFCLLGLDPFDLFCLMSLVSRLQYMRERLFFFFFTCSVNKEKRRNIQDFCISSNRTLHLQQFISFGIWEQIRKETSGSSSVNSLQFRQIHFLFLASELIKVWFGSV